MQVHVHVHSHCGLLFWTDVHPFSPWLFLTHAAALDLGFTRSEAASGSNLVCLENFKRNEMRERLALHDGEIWPQSHILPLRTFRITSEMEDVKKTANIWNLCYILLAKQKLRNSINLLTHTVFKLHPSTEKQSDSENTNKEKTADLHGHVKIRLWDS